MTVHIGDQNRESIFKAKRLAERWSNRQDLPYHVADPLLLFPAFFDFGAEWPCSFLQALPHPSIAPRTVARLELRGKRRTSTPAKRAVCLEWFAMKSTQREALKTPDEWLIDGHVPLTPALKAIWAPCLGLSQQLSEREDSRKRQER